MASDIILQNVTQEQFDAAESVLVALIRSAYPSLDLRKGTVIRDLLIRPAASVYALDTDRWTYLQNKMSLMTVTNNVDYTASDIDAILANFGMIRDKGSLSGGQVKVVVDTDRTYSLATGFSFTTIDGLTYVTTKAYTIKSNPDLSAGETQLQQAVDGSYFFIVDVLSTAVGVAYNILQGVALDLVSTLYGFVSAAAYTDFTGGTDGESLTQAITRLPAAISYRALDSRTSIGAKLNTHTLGAGYPLYSLKVQGFGDIAQLRDKHNPMGFGVGSRVDVYPKTFIDPSVITLQKTGTLIGPNAYQFTLTQAECYGLYAIRSVSEVEASFSVDQSFASIAVLGSYAFVDGRQAEGIANTSHDIDPDNAVIESAGTCYQKSIVTVTGVPFTDATHEFKVELYVCPGVKDLQDYVDSDGVKNVEADYLIRAPFMCMVGLKVKAYYLLTNPVDIDVMRQDLVTYINNNMYKNVLTRSELTGLMLNAGMSRVDMTSTGMILQGSIRDAAGNIRTLSGDVLDVRTIEDQYSLLTSDTIVYATELPRIYIEAIGE